MSTANVGSDIEAICPKCGDSWHIVVAKIGDGIASVECKSCGGRRRYDGPGAAVQPVPRDADVEPEYRFVERGRLADGALTRRLARWLHDLGATAPITRAAVAALAAAEPELAFQEDDEFSGLRFRVGGMTAFLTFDHAGGDIIQAFVKLAEQSRAGKKLDELHAAICSDVAAELGPPTATGRDTAVGKARWSAWRAPAAILFVLQVDDFIRQEGETVTLWLVPWADAALPDVGGDVAAWIIKLGRARRG